MKEKNDNVVWRLLRCNISVTQLAGYALAGLTGLTILLTALQLYRDVTHAREHDDTLISRDYLIISKKVSGGLTSLFSGGNSTVFSDAEIEEISSQPWARKVGSFTASDFNVAASVELGGRGMSTYLFFESIPDEFFDVRPSGWDFDPERDNTVPIVLSKDYLSLYNFGFAASRGLPQISESTISLLPLKVSVSGRGRQQWLNARIVGFSSRLNTIAVPEGFMKWANENFADTPSEGPSRLIIEADAKGDPGVESFLRSHGYEAAGDGAVSGKANYVMSLTTGVVGVIGIVISALSLFILLLSIWLLLQKNSEKIHQLLLLGYTPSAVARYYYMIVAGVNCVVLIGALIVTAIVQQWWATPLQAIGASPASLVPTLLIGLGLMTLVTAINMISIRHKIISRYFQS